MAKGIPNIAYEPLELDDIEYAKLLKRRNRRDHGLGSGKQPTQRSSKPCGAERAVCIQFENFDCTELEVLADLWCAMFVWPKRFNTSIPTQQTFLALSKGETTLNETWKQEIQTLSHEFRFFHWNLRFAEIFGGDRGRVARGSSAGFDIIIGNPPWVAHAGRSTQKLLQGQKHFMFHCYSSFRGYPTTHGVFVEMATRVLAEGGRIGFIMPASVADLAGYAPTRAAHDEQCVLLCPLPDYGEGRFAGVTQPCIALVSQLAIGGRPIQDRGKPWHLNRRDLDATGAALLTKLESLAPLPPELFGERGFQSTPQLRKHIRKTTEPDPPYTLAMREGSDVREFQLGEPRLYADGAALSGALRPLREFSLVSLVLRQTARYPVAARSDSLAFRNSLLAVLSHNSWPWPLLLCLLNSSLLRWCHYHRYRDGRQPILPQLKVGHLRSLPAPMMNDSAVISMLERLGADLAQRNRGILDQERMILDDCVCSLYALEHEEKTMVTLWHSNRPR